MHTSLLAINGSDENSLAYVRERVAQVYAEVFEPAFTLAQVKEQLILDHNNAEIFNNKVLTVETALTTTTTKATAAYDEVFD